MSTAHSHTSVPSEFFTKGCRCRNHSGPKPKSKLTKCSNLVLNFLHRQKLKEEGVTPTAPKEEVKPEVKPEEPPKKKPAQPQPKPVLTSAPKVPDLTSITDAFAEVKPIAQNPSVLADVIKILQTIFDFKRIMNDMQRILHGDLKGVLQEYPERAAGFFRMVHNLPHRFLGAKEKVEEVQRAR